MKYRYNKDICKMISEIIAEYSNVTDRYGNSPEMLLGNEECFEDLRIFEAYKEVSRNYPELFKKVQKLYDSYNNFQNTLEFALNNSDETDPMYLFLGKSYHIAELSHFIYGWNDVFTKFEEFRDSIAQFIEL